MKLDRNLSYDEELILNLIPDKKPVLSKDAVTRKVMQRITGIKSREISYIIEELRKYYPICSTRGNKGYWLGNKAEAMQFAKECRAHANGLIETAKNLEDMFDDNSNLDEFGD